jgi:hypothetical protein
MLSVSRTSVLLFSNADFMFTLTYQTELQTSAEGLDSQAHALIVLEVNISLNQSASLVK